MTAALGVFSLVLFVLFSTPPRSEFRPAIPPVQEKDESYFPLEPGMEWTFLVDGGLEEVRRIGARTTIRGRECVSVSPLCMGMSGTPHLYSGPEGIRILSPTTEPDVLWLKLPLQKGNRWSLGSAGEAEVLGEEEIVVPAGRFRCWKITRLFSSALLPARITSWLARGVGEVRSVIALGDPAKDSVTRVLKRFLRRDLPQQETLELVLDADKKVKMEFVKIKAGKFTMGDKDFDDATPHEVTISNDYWMQTTETTQGQWEAVMGKNPSFFKGADLPVETVSREECQEFLKKLNEKAKDQLKGKAAKLPTEAEWEYACRAGEKGKWCFGDDEKKLSEYAWSEKNSDDKTYPVGQKKPNAWGLYDMHGNVWEWCEDWYEMYPSGAVTDPTGPAKGQFRCLRGGGWFNGGGDSRSAYRGRNLPAYRFDVSGLRASLR